MFSVAASTKSRVSFAKSSSESFPAWPKSTNPSSPVSRTKMFAGCGSEWKKPWRKTIVIQVSAIR